MKDIFSELYNKVLGFFRQTEKKEESATETAKGVACNRLKVVLMQDRTNLTPELMNRMRKELVELLSKYVEMDKEALELGFEQEGTQMALMLSIPVVRAKDEAEIEAILAKEDEEKAKIEAAKESDTNNDITSEDDTEGISDDTSEDISEDSHSVVTSEDDTEEISDETENQSDEEDTETVLDETESETADKEPVAVAAASSRKRK